MKEKSKKKQKQHTANIFRNSIIHFLFPYEPLWGDDQQENEIMIVSSVRNEWNGKLAIIESESAIIRDSFLYRDEAPFERSHDCHEVLLELMLDLTEDHKNENMSKKNHVDGKWTSAVRIILSKSVKPQYVPPNVPFLMLKSVIWVELSKSASKASDLIFISKWQVSFINSLAGV